MLFVSSNRLVPHGVHDVGKVLAGELLIDASDAKGENNHIVDLREVLIHHPGA